MTNTVLVRPAAKARGAHIAGAGAWVVPDQVFDGADLRHDCAVRIEGNRVRLINKAEVPAGPDHETGVFRVSGIISPGFFDIQVNGGGGVLLNATPTAAAIRAIAAAHRSAGTVGLLPTLITDHPDVLAQAVAAILASHGQGGVMGMHIEGPHISQARRGTHAAAHVRPLDSHTTGLIAQLRERQVPVMITLAPEAAAPGQIAALVETGVIVAIGHSDATADQVRAALAEGATCFTHLFNAMSQMQNREAGVTGAAINSCVYCSMIADGIHVAPEMLELAVRARPVADRMILVSDAMPTVAGPDEFALYGRTIHLQDGRLVNDAGALAGAHTTMLQSLHFVVDMLNVPVETALRMAITNPARLMGVEGAFQIEHMAASDLLILAPGMTTAEFVANQGVTEPV
jgi:N-acetylglucosamine-6-phosphate deacetylase